MLLLLMMMMMILVWVALSYSAVHEQEGTIHALGTTDDCFTDGLSSRPSPFNDLALLACINYTYSTVSHALTYTQKESYLDTNVEI